MTNRFCQESQFYEFIKVESNVRGKSKDMERVYFILLFACCREIAKSKKGLGISESAEQGFRLS